MTDPVTPLPFDLPAALAELIARVEQVIGEQRELRTMIAELQGQVNEVQLDIEMLLFDDV